MKHRKEEGRYLIVLDKGDEVVESLTSFVEGRQTEGGLATGGNQWKRQRASANLGTNSHPTADCYE